MTALAVLLAFVSTQTDVPPAAEPPSTESPPAATGAVHFRGALETLFQTFPSGTPGGQQDLFGHATPVLAFDGGEDFAFELGATLRLRVFDDPPEQRPNDYGQLLRREDWDQTSDYGQLIRELRIGKEDSAFSLWAGPAQGYTLGHGHLVARYSNRENTDYHPAAAGLSFTIGPTQTELFASDFLGARLFAAEVDADMGRILGEDPAAFDRYHLSFSVAHDAGVAGGRAPPVTLMHFDFDAALHRAGAVQVFAFAGIGSRIFVPAADLGAVAGLSVDGATGPLRLGGKFEARKQGGGFRHGMFGPAYELARFAGTGLAGEPVASEQLPDAFSGYAEFRIASGGEAAPPAEPFVSFSAAGEYFSFGRTDADAALAMRILGGRGLATLRASVIGVGVRPRYALGGEGRFRFAPAFYAVAAGGTVFFPQPDSTLVRGVYAGAGVGVDFER
ncbi:MAG: hypothetical protein ACOZIN_02465 [Myxococcota bacterium]